MTKLLEATCAPGKVVTAEDIVVVEADVLSEGTKASAGVLLLDGLLKKYLTSNASDIKDLITALVSIIEQIETTLTTIDGVTVSPGTATAGIAQITALRSQLDASKETLK